MTAVSFFAQPGVHATPAGTSRTEGTAPAEAKSEHGHDHDAHHRVPKRGLKILRSEMMRAFAMQFSAFRQNQTADGYAKLESVSQTAGEILSATKLLVEAQPESRAATLIRIRQSMTQAVATASAMVSEPDDAAEVDATIQAVDDGLNDIEETGARTESMSLTTVDTVSRARTSLRIRTQEGDFVKLEVRRMDEMSATDIAIDDGDNSLTYTEVQVSSRSRLMLKVKGDLNESELAAIRDVFAQAEQLADDFFSGDINAALEVAAGLNFDAEQIAGVSLKFRAFQASSISQTLVENRLPAIAASEPEVPALDAGVGEVSDADLAPAANNVEPAAELEPAAAEQPETVGEVLPSPFQALADFFAQLTEFLDLFAATIDPVPAPALPDLAPKYEFTLPVKIDMLKATFAELAPAGTAQEPEAIVDKLVEVASAGLDGQETASA